VADEKMLKKIDASQLKLGMYIHDLSCDWMTHPFVRNRFLISTDDDIRKIRDAGIHDVVIDATRGLDVQDAPTLAEAQAQIEAELTVIATAPVVTRVALAEELKRAAMIRHQASGLVRTVMQDARLGRAIELDQVSPMVQNITESILRNPGALMSLLRIKTADDYTFLHSVSVCTCWWRSAGRAAWMPKPPTRAGWADCCTTPARRWCPTRSSTSPAR
jgi:hypothetical protein